MVIFPFSAVVANETLKLALTLSVIDPKMGGVLIRGFRGSAKSTLARSVVDIASLDAKKFVLLPLGADEERLIGSIDLEAVLRDGDINFRPGLLHQAHQGILYVDEVNLLADSLVDVLLDVCASGVNTIERDAVSTSHPASFVLIGTMNPDEGELRPQLLDRFGLCVDLQQDLDVEQRMLVVERRIAFDQDPELFAQQYHDEQLRIIEAIQHAQQHISGVTVSVEAQRYACEICYQAQVEGVRADITLRRAAMAYAALQGLNEVSHDCIDKVAEFVLNHRRQTGDSSNTRSDAGQSGTNNSDRASQSDLGDGNDSHPESNNGQGDWGEMPAIQVPVGESRDVKSALTTATSSVLKQSQKKNRKTGLDW